LVIADKNGGVSSSDSPESNISIINFDNNYETKSIKTRKKSIDKEITERTHGKG
jgi:hypothetical protein